MTILGTASSPYFRQETNELAKYPRRTRLERWPCVCIFIARLFLAETRDFSQSKKNDLSGASPASRVLQVSRGACISLAR